MTIARYTKFTAADGGAEKVTRLLLAAAADLADDAGCEQYLVSRQADQPETVWVTELWRSQADLDASLAQLKDNPKVAQVMALVAAVEPIELELQGGKR